MNADPKGKSLTVADTVSPERMQAIQDELERHSKDTIMATSKLHMESMQVRANRPNWKSYLQSNMISQDDYNFITAYEITKGDEHKSLIDNNKIQCAKTFISLMSNISKDQTVRCVLIMIDDMLKEDPTRVQIFANYARKERQSVWSPFLAMLNRSDGFIINQVSIIIAKMACFSQELMDGADLTYYLVWLKDRLKSPGNEYLQTTARCLQMMLRIDEYRYAFVNLECVNT
ncbi:unnamed protein product [Soboliphyme baturini]|uniref:V-ATPase_H_C domain-containing protein n=1 Tax=Soboliphyme baturini TaxID=241478 RepID=A0A183IRN5_9BILA|nr:unnamed protein product [Soboliphyme baturini]